MDESVKKWLARTILFQSLLLIGCSAMWLFFMLLITIEVGYYSAWQLLIAGSILGWTGYVLILLFQNIRATNAFRISERTIDWQQAMQHQLVFWKQITFITLLYLLWIAFFLIATIMFSSWGNNL
jgi:hypothetical protein